MPDEVPRGPQYWTAQRRAAVALSVLRGETSTEEAARSLGLTLRDVEAWKEEFLASAEQALQPYASDRALEGAIPRDDLGVWICAESRDSLAPCLLMQAVCDDRFPLPATAKWTGVGSPARALRRSGEVSLIHGIWSPDSRPGIRLFLYGARLAAPPPLERRTALSEWIFPVEVAGIVVLLDEQEERGSFNRILHGLGPSGGGRALKWAKAQGVPLVVAAMGFESGSFSADRFRESHDLPSDVPIVIGPPVRRSRLSREERSSEVRKFSISGLLGVGDLQFDSDYAGRLLRRIHQELLYGSLRKNSIP